MANEILKSLLKEYEQMRRNAELDLDRRKNELYNKRPRLREIEEELNKYAINAARKVLSDKNYTLDGLNKKAQELKKEKEEILKEENLHLNFLEPKYSCSICKDTGYVVGSDYKTVMCSCLKQRLLDISYNKSNMSNLYKENFDNFNLGVFSDEVDVKKFGQRISPRKNMEFIKNSCIKFIENFDDLDSKNLLFTGNTGLRKNFHV